MLNKHLPNVLWNISFPFCLKSFWRLGKLFSKKTSSEKFSSLMTQQTATVSALLGHSQYHSSLEQEPKKLRF